MNQRALEQAVASLRAWASRVGARITIEPPLTDDVIDIFPQLIKPHLGTFQVTVPPSYRELLRFCSRLNVDVAVSPKPDWETSGTFLSILSPDTIIDRRGCVLFGAVEGEDNRVLTTNHLLAFAYADHRESFWCLVTDAPDDSGELPVVKHSIDGFEAARFVDDGTYCDPEAARPQFSSFDSWLAAQLEAVLRLTRADLLRALGYEVPG